MNGFDELLAEGAAVDVSTWSSGFLPGRHHEGPPPWRYADIACPYLADGETLLDMGTGDGGKLLDLAPLPPHAVAYEEWAPTIPAARAALAPAGIGLVRCRAAAENYAPEEPGDVALPFRDSAFDVVVNRHECFAADDVRRVLRPGGHFVTQQVGGRFGTELRALIGHPPVEDVPWGVAEARAQTEAAGLTVVDSGEGSTPLWWTDVGALVAYLRSVPWHVPDFDITAYRDRLRALHGTGEATVGLSLFWLAARRDR